MPEKPREASYVCSVLDDCAAVSNTVRLDQVIARADKHVRALVPVSEDEDGNTFAYIEESPRAGMWTAIHAAASFRREAVEARVTGDMTRALRLESESEKALSLLALLGRGRA